jgi:BlaI family transcriptional regulator, penicillinase repressor
MRCPELNRPTDGELEILAVLWASGPSTVRQVYEKLKTARDTGYTTVLKLLQIMRDKGLVVRDESERSHVYRAARQQESTQRQLVKNLLTRAFGGSAEKLVMQALSFKNVTPHEIAAIRKLLDAIEESK